MIADVMAVMWKEAKEILAYPRSGGARGGWLNLALILGVFGVFLPWQTGRAWVDSPQVLVYWAWVPLFLVTGVVADSFAGERERRTLETLLASRLPDRAILFGKIGAAMAYGWGLSTLSLVLGVVTVNVAYGGDGLLLYPPLLLWGGLALSLLGSGLAAGAGVLVSLRAQTVRQAAQTMSVAILLLLFVPVFGFRYLPVDLRARLAELLAGAGLARPVLAVALLLAVADVALFAAAVARFRRDRLTLD